MTLIELWIQTPVMWAIGWTLFHSLWEGGSIAIALGIALLFLHSSRARYAAACVAMLATVITFGVTLLVFASRSETQSLRTYSSGNRSVTVGSNDVYFQQVAESKGITDILPWTAPLWMVGVVFAYIRLLASWVGAQRWRRRGVCQANVAWQDSLSALAKRLHLSKPIGLLESCFVDVPVVVGHMRPLILVPLGLLAGLPPAQVEALLLHELAHIRRYDYIVNLVQRIVESLLFYHPAIWWMAGIVREERENCCDDLVIATKGSAEEYVRALMALEETRWNDRTPALATNGGNLVKRIRRLLYPSEGPSMAFTPLLAAGMLLVAAVITVWKSPATEGAVVPVAEQTSQVALLSGVQNPIVPRTLTSPRPEITPAGSQGRSAEFDTWMDDVGYIISVAERTAFEGLQTDAERDQFIKQFWLRRDPTPDSSENEFKETHYRRIAEANQRFASPAGTPGWKTDRGRIYVQYGRPDELETTLANRAQQNTYAVERWRYAVVDGTYADFEFADFSATGDFRLIEKQGSIAPVPRLPQPISIKMRAPLPKMLEIVSEAAGVTFVIPSSDNRGLVTVDVRDALLPQILDAIFLPIGLQYTVDGKRVIVSRPVLPTATARPQTEYRIGDVKISGATVLNEAQIKDVLGLVPGDVYNESRLRKGFEDLKRIYNARGYANFTPIPALNFDDQQKVVNLTINIEENG